MLRHKTELRIPGPVPVPPAVLQAASHPMINHRGKVFKEMFPRIMQRLQPIFGTKQPVQMITGSGTAAMEVAVANLVSPGDPVLVLVGGAFGQRWKNLCDAYKAQVTVLEYPWGEQVDAGQVQAILATNPDIKAVFATHNESSTAVLNDLQALGKVVAGHQALLVVDAVSSLGGAEIQMDAWEIDVVCTASQKCLMVPPGLAFVSFSPQAMERAAGATSSRFYFNINSYADMLEKGETPYTPNISLLFGLEVALDMIEEEGLDVIYRRHYLMRDMVRAGIHALELPLLTDDKAGSPTTTGTIPADLGDVDAFRARVRDHFGVELAGGQGKFAGKIFRIGHMGYATPLDMLTCLAAIEMAVNKPGCATAAAEKVWQGSF